MKKWYDLPGQKSKWGEGASTLGLYPTEKYLIDKHFKPQSSLLNIGCGGGREALALAGTFKVTAMDFSPEFCDICEKSAKEAGVKIDVKVGNATSLDFKENSFDCLIMVGQLIGHLRPRSTRIKVLSEAVRVLKTDGIGIVSTNAIELGLTYRIYFALANLVRRVYNPYELEADDAFVFRVGSRSKDILKKENRPVFHWYRTPEFISDATEAGFKLVEFCRRYEFESENLAKKRATGGETFYVLKKTGQ